jgi:hypothetical protein
METTMFDDEKAKADGNVKVRVEVEFSFVFILLMTFLSWHDRCSDRMRAMKAGRPNDSLTFQ